MKLRLVPRARYSREGGRSSGSQREDPKRNTRSISPTGGSAPRASETLKPACDVAACVTVTGKRKAGTRSYDRAAIHRPQLHIGFVRKYSKYVHTYVILTDGGAEGRRYYLRAGPDESGNGVGNITVSYGDDAKKWDVHRNAATQYVGEVDMSFEEARDALEKYGQRVDAAQIPYRLSANSNSFAAQAPTAVGLPRALPAGDFGDPKGHDTILNIDGGD